MTRRELSAVVAECAARSERAEASIKESRAGIEEARRRQEEAVARQEVATAKFENLMPRWEEERAAMREAGKRQEKMLQDYVRRTDEMIAEGRAWMKKITAEFQDQRDERRALMEALFQMMDRLPPPPPNLRSA